MENANAKRNLNLYALTSMKANNQNEKHEAVVPPCLDNGLLFKGNKSKRRERENKI